MIEVDRAAFKQLGVQARELMHRTKDGQLFPASATARRITMNGRDAVIVLAEDISERRMAEDALQSHGKCWRCTSSKLPWRLSSGMWHTA